MKKLAWKDADAKGRFDREREYLRDECKGSEGCKCGNCCKPLNDKRRARFPAEAHGGVDPDEMGHKKHKEIGKFAQDQCGGMVRIDISPSFDLFAPPLIKSQVRNPQLLATRLSWRKQIYYDVFHCDKNNYVNTVWMPTVDIYAKLDLSDELSRELWRTHRLSNLNVGQTEACVEEARGEGETREKHKDINGGEVRTLRMKRTKLHAPIGGITETFSVLMPLVRASGNTRLKKQIRTDALNCFKVLHRLHTSFDQAAAIRLSVSKRGDHSVEHQAHVKIFFDILTTEINAKLCPGMKDGSAYMSWPDHYMAHHLSEDMRVWAELTNGVPFGRSSNQVSEHMNKVIKRHLKRHSNSQVSTDDLRNSKFRQVLRWMAIPRLNPERFGKRRIRKGKPCAYCVRQGADVTGGRYHERRTSDLCPFKKARQARGLNGNRKQLARTIKSIEHSSLDAQMERALNAT